MEKYKKILTLYEELVSEINALNEIKFEKLKLGLELSILDDKMKKLEVRGEKNK